jgi:predicted pyridoxine 5'-phosphate oxidase superfamily flavin-nucleotide-binding protein
MGLSLPFHEGEIEVQRRVGVADEAQAVGRIVAREVSSGAARFLQGQRMAVATSLDAAGRPWVSVLSGPAGFLHAVDERLLRIDAAPAADDPLAANLSARPELGLLVLDPRTRRRMRFNGRGLAAEDGLFVMTDEVYGNCPKYIQRRRVVGDVAAPRGASVRSRTLDARQQGWIARADTFFIGTYHPDGGADASHRGGDPGFVRVLDERRLLIPDYPGNAMFNTLGNLIGQPNVGLLFLDFASGDTLQLTGRAEVRFEPSRAIAVEIDEVRETPHGHRLRWDLLEDAPGMPGA